MDKHTKTLTTWFKNPSLSRDYFYLFIAIIITTIITSCYFTWLTYQAYLDKVKYQLELEAERIEHKIDGVFNDIAQILILIGKEIVRDGNPDSLDHIYFLLKENSKIKIKATDFITHDSFIWINAHNYQVINMKEGVVKHPYNMSHRTHLEKCKKHLWTLGISEPGIGIPNGLPVIPIGVGVADDKGHYLGNIALGLRIKELTSSIERELDSAFTNFIILDNNNNLIMNSSNSAGSMIKDYLLTHKISLSHENKGLFSPFEINNVTYLYSRKIPKSPYVVLVGLDKRVINNEFHAIVFPRVLEFLGFGIFCILLLYFFRRKIINPITRLSQIAVSLSAGKTALKIPRQSSIEMHHLAKALLQVTRYIKRNERMHDKLKEAFDLAKNSDEIKEEFLRRVNDELKRPLYSIHWYSEILLKHAKKEIQVYISTQRQVEMLDKIQEAVNNLYTLTTNVLNLSDVDVNDVLAYCLKIEAKKAIIKNVKLESSLPPFLPLLYADKLRIEQIIVGLISLCIDYSYEKSTICISSSLEKIDQSLFLKIIFEDDGFAFDKEEILRLSSSINKKSAGHALNISDLDLELVEKLVNMHEGSLEILSLGQKGKRIILTLPYRDKATLDIYSRSNASKECSKGHNILRFSKK